MTSHLSRRALAICTCVLLGSLSQAEEPKSYDGCTAVVDKYFLDEVWAKVGSQKCLTCHKAGGDAEKSQFVLVDPQRATGAEQEKAIRHNHGAFTKLSKLKEGKEHRILLKVTGGLEHGGEDVLKPDSTGYKIVAEFVRRVNDPHAGSPSAKPLIDLAEDKNLPPFFDGVTMLGDRQLLRRATLSLAGRLPTETELAAISKDGLKALPTILDEVMKEDAFYKRLREGFNDIFLTVGYDDGAESALSYEHFSTTRHWTQKHDLSHVGDEKAQTLSLIHI